MLNRKFAKQKYSARQLNPACRNRLARSSKVLWDRLVILMDINQQEGYPGCLKTRADFHESTYFRISGGRYIEGK